jgi:hypothetical protein
VKGIKTVEILQAGWKLRVGLLLLVASLSLSCGVRAQSAVPGSSAALRPALESFTYFVGHWSCEGEFVAVKKATAAEISIAADLGGSVLSFRWDDKLPSRFHALELWGFDQAADHFTNFIHDNFGGVRQFNSAGWEGDTLTWTGNALATPPATNERFVLQRKSAKEFVISYDTRKGQGDWATIDRLTCRQ